MKPMVQSFPSRERPGDRNVLKSNHCVTKGTEHGLPEGHRLTSGCREAPTMPMWGILPWVTGWLSEDGAVVLLRLRQHAGGRQPRAPLAHLCRWVRLRVVGQSNSSWGRAGRQVLLSFYSRSWKEHICSFNPQFWVTLIIPGVRFSALFLQVSRGISPRPIGHPWGHTGDVPSSLPGCPWSLPGASLVGRWIAIVKICAQNKGCDAQGLGQSGPP